MLNVVNLLKLLSKGENYFIKVDNYNRIGVSSVDEFNLFENKEKPLPTPFKLIGNDTRINISVENKVYGTVKINPIQAKRVGLPNTISSVTYKNKTIIKDNVLNINNMDVIVDMPTYLQLVKHGVEFTTLTEQYDYPGMAINIKLEGLPMVHSMETTLEEILNNVEKITELKMKRKVLKGLLKQYKVEEDIPGFTAEQTQLLKDHGLNEKLQYAGVSNVEKPATETYTAEIINFKLKNSSSSSFEKMLERVEENKTLNKCDTIQYEYYLELTKTLSKVGSEMSKMILSNYLSEVSAQINKITINNVIIKMQYLAMTSEIAMDSLTDVKYKDLKIEFKTETFKK